MNNITITKAILSILAIFFIQNLNFSQSCLPEGITFTSQEQIDNFQTNYPRCNSIMGNVIIESEVKSICGYLISPNSYPDIEYNSVGCNSISEIKETCPAAVEEIKFNDRLLIIPNPANDKISIQSPCLVGEAQFSIFNVDGEKVMERQLTDTETQIDISALPQGVYFVRLQNNEIIKIAKIIKNK